MADLHRLDLQASRIEAVLASHKVSGRVWGGRVTPRFVQFELTTGLGVKVAKVSSLAEEIALSLGVRSARVYRKRDTIQVEVPREHPEPVLFLSLCRVLQEVPRVSALLGLDEEGMPLLLRFPSPDVAHVLVAGTTGSGKTALMRCMLLSLVMFNRQADVQLLLIDPKGHGLAPLARVPHLLRPVVTEVEDVPQTLRWLLNEMERRDQEGMRNGRLGRPAAPHLVVAVDELADLIQTGGREVEAMLTRLAQRGREAGIHLLAATQKPSAAAIGSLLKANFPVRVVGSVTSAEEAKLASGMPGTGAERLTGAGDFILVARGELIRFQAAWMSLGEIKQVVARLRAGGRKTRHWE
ncbi:MAG TPA: DUF87 domain-containing protein [Anaerolineae bacterium]|nr:DUF87 domain-containing protein [Anaerolineae bacterium]